MYRRLSLVIAATVLSAGLAKADPITLKVADILPAGHYISKNSIGFWMSELSRLAGDRIKFQYYPAEQLGKARDMYTLLRSGAVDIAYVAPGYIPEKFPLSGVVELPRMTTSACGGTKIYSKLLHGGFLDQKEFRPNGLVPLITFMTAPSQLQSRGEPNQPVFDLKGLKVRGEGSAMDMTIRTLGGVPIQVPGPDIRQALERGTIDAVVGLSPSAVTYEHVKFLNYFTANANLSAPGLTYSMSAARWQSLPPDLQELIRKVSDEAATQFCTADDELEQTARAQMRSLGLKAIDLTPEEEKQLDAQVAVVRARWVDTMNSRGLPGQQAFDAFNDAR